MFLELLLIEPPDKTRFLKVVLFDTVKVPPVTKTVPVTLPIVPEDAAVIVAFAGTVTLPVNVLELKANVVPLFNLTPPTEILPLNVHVPAVSVTESLELKVGAEMVVPLEFFQVAVLPE